MPQVLALGFLGARAERSLHQNDVGTRVIAEVPRRANYNYNI